MRLIGMIHLAALPGSPQCRLTISEMTQQACAEARVLKAAGFDSLLVENMHDRPYQRGGATPETVAGMTLACAAVKAESGLACGVQVLAGANREAIAIAYAAGLDFIRAEGFVFAHVGDEGIHESCAASLLRYRHTLGADHIRVYTDIKKKHSSHAMTADLDIAETARAAEFFLSDGLIITGLRTGHEPEMDDVKSVRSVTSLPVIIGSGVTAENVRSYLDHASAVIAGSSLKEDGSWFRPVCPRRAAAFISAANRTP